jgi:hypothetical protein
MSAKQALWMALILGATAVTVSCGPLEVDGHAIASPVTIPAQIETYPRVRFHGDYAYLVGHDWYYRDGWYGWVVFRDEPVELRTYRIKQTHSTSSVPASEIH